MGEPKKGKCPRGLPRYNPGAQACHDCLNALGTIYCPLNGKSAFNTYLGKDRYTEKKEIKGMVIEEEEEG